MTRPFVRALQWCLPFAIASASVLASEAFAQTVPADTLTGEWDGLRSELINRGVDITASYTSEVANNLAGGDREETRYTDQWTLGSSFDLGRLSFVPDAEVKILVTERNGRDLSQDAGLHTYQLVQEVYGRGQTWRLTQFEYRQAWFGSALDAKFGRLTVGEDFGSFSCDFQNLTFCGSQPGNVRGELWYNWPVSQWGARVKSKLTGNVALAVGVYQLNPTYIDDTWAHHSGLTLDNPAGTLGALIPIEVSWLPRLALPGTYKAGAWLVTAEVSDDHSPGVSHRPYGAYLSLQQRVWGAAQGAGLDVFLNTTDSDSRTAASTDRQTSLGLELHGVADRAKDSIGVAIGTTHARDAIDLAEPAATTSTTANRPTGGSEFVLEIFYGWTPFPFVTFRPNLQVIRHPGGNTESAEDVIVGLKSSVTF